jgi:hypothetical protein
VKYDLRKNKVLGYNNNKSYIHNEIKGTVSCVNAELLSFLKNEEI